MTRRANRNDVTMTYAGRKSNAKKRTSRKAPAKGNGKGWGRWFRKNTKHVLRGVGDISLTMLKNKLGLNTETKFLDTDLSAAPATTALTLTQFLTPTQTLIAQGLTTKTRNGDQIRMTRFRVQGQVINGPANIVQNTTVRIIGVNWGTSPASVVSISDVLEATSTMESLYAMDPPHSHTIIYDKMFPLGPTGNFALPNVYNWSFDYKPMAHHIKWNEGDTAGTEANILRGYVVFYAICSAFTAANAPTITTYSRIEFVDN